MTAEVPIPNPALSRKEAAAFAKLSPEDIISIDDGIIASALSRWRKVAMVVSIAEERLRARYPQFSYILYAKRIRLLAKQGRLESQGNLRYMRFSEVKLPNENQALQRTCYCARRRSPPLSRGGSLSLGC
jgi:hypothetical protein